MDKTEIIARMRKAGYTTEEAVSMIDVYVCADGYTLDEFADLMVSVIDEIDNSSVSDDEWAARVNALVKAGHTFDSACQIAEGY